MSFNNSLYYSFSNPFSFIINFIGSLKVFVKSYTALFSEGTQLLED